MVVGVRPIEGEGSLMFDINGFLSEYHLGDYHEDVFWTGEDGKVQNLGYFDKDGIHSDEYWPGDIAKYRFEPISYDHSANVYLLNHPPGNFQASDYHVWEVWKHNDYQDYGETERRVQHLPNY